jgi:N-acetylglucosamine kinase-like BadF-type ATPase
MDFPESLIIGVDGGATKTQLAVANTDGELLGVYEAAGTYHVLTGALGQMVTLLQPISNKHIITAVFAVAGWDFEPDQAKQRELIETALTANGITVDKAVYENDIYATLKSAKDLAEPAVVISCGTGIIGLAAGNGTYYQTPGYEYLSGEWGSGIHQAEYAIHLACASLLGREDHYPILIQKALDYFEATDLNSLVDQIINHFAGNKKRGYFLKPVYEAYAEGCPGAARVVHRAGEELAKTAWCLLKKLEGNNVKIIFGGGVIKQFGLPSNFKSQLHHLTQQQHDCYLVNSAPVYGSLHWALQLSGLPTALVEDYLDVSFINF